AAGAAAVVLALLVVAVGSTVALLNVRRANAQSQREAAKAKAVSDFLENTLSAADPTKQGRDVTVAEVVTRAARSIPDDFKGQPEVEAAVRQTIARTSQALGLNAQAIAHAKAGVHIRRPPLAPTAQAMRQAKAPLAIRERPLGPTHPDTLAALFVLAENESILGHYPEAEALHRRAWEGPQAERGREAGDQGA